MNNQISKYFVFKCVDYHTEFMFLQMDQDENQKSDKRRQSLSIDKAAFLLLRIKRVFKKRSQSHHIEKRFFFSFNIISNSIYK